MLWIVALIGGLIAALWAMTRGYSQSGSRVPSDGWRLSENGNKTRVLGSDRITIYGSSRSWKFCVADATKDDDFPYFSESYETEAIAMEEALAFIRGDAPAHQSNQERRRQEADDALPLQAESRLSKLSDLEKTVSFYEEQKNPNKDKLRSLLKRAEKERSSMLRQSADFIASDNVALSEDEVFAILDRHDRVLASIDALLKR